MGKDYRKRIGQTVYVAMTPVVEHAQALKEQAAPIP
jgi:hypothetical protein